MTVLVTGGAGYLGSHIVLDNLSTTGFRWAVPPEVTLVVGDVGDQALRWERILVERKAA